MPVVSGDAVLTTKVDHTCLDRTGTSESVNNFRPTDWRLELVAFPNNSQLNSKLVEGGLRSCCNLIFV
jgi:hypothetical protein